MSADFVPATPEEIAKGLAIWSDGHDPISRLIRTLAAQVEEQNQKIETLEKILASVPDLIRTSFEEGFVGSDAAHLGQAWNQSRSRKFIDGEATPIPSTWATNRDKVAILEVELSSLRSQLSEAQAKADRVAVLPALTPDHCLEIFDITQDGPPYDEVIPKLTDHLCKILHTVSSSSVLGEGEEKVRTDDLRSLIAAGHGLSNAAFNLSQKDVVLPEWRRSLKDGYERWDSARSKIEDAIRASKGVG